MCIQAVQRDNDISLVNQLFAVRHDDDDAIVLDGVQLTDKGRLRRFVETRGRLIKQDDGAIQIKRAGNIETLALSAGQGDAIISKCRLPLLRQVFDECVRHRKPGRVPDAVR